MKEKYFCVNEIYVGCLGNISYLGTGNGANWTKKDINPYVAFKIFSSDKLDGCHEGKNVLCNERYYFLNEVSRTDINLEIAHGRYVIGKSVPLNIVSGEESCKISSTELKSIICNFNITDALIKFRNDGYLLLLKKCLDDIDLMGNGRVKEYYIDKITDLVTDYTSTISDSCTDSRNFDKIIDDINYVRQELDKEREIIVKKAKKLNKGFTKR